MEATRAKPIFSALDCFTHAEPLENCASRWRTRVNNSAGGVKALMLAKAGDMLVVARKMNAAGEKRRA